jgi:CBS domain-containing protein
MDTVDQILKEKGSKVHKATPGDTVVEAVERMCSEKVGALLVCEAGHPVGMFTERDLMTKVILGRLDPATTTVGEVMSREVVYVEPTAGASEAMAVMTERRCRHLPVASEGRLLGIVSIGDLVRWASRSQEFEIRKLTDYIHGKYPG